MDRRKFLAASTVASALPMYRSGSVTAQDEVEERTHRPDYSDYSKDPRPDVPEGTCTAGAKNGPVFDGFPVVSGPSSDSISILQPLQRTATGFLEYQIENGSWNRVEAGEAGLLPLSNNVLKFRLPKLPQGKAVIYRIVAHSIGWTKVRQFYHGVVEKGERQVSKQYRFKTINPKANETKFAVWNDTHENDATIADLVKQTKDFEPDFLLWNGDQSNDCHFEQDMAGQFLNPAGLSIADAWPLAYVRGNHECRGPAARSLPEFTGSPGDLFYYGFRSGPLAALVMDTGEDKPDDHPNFGGMANFEVMQRTQAQWLREIVKEQWFRTAPHKVLFCHIPLWFKASNSSYDGHRLCRELWGPTLIESGVKLVISGHTHRSAWLPKSELQPIAQLVGGSPHPKFATLISATANASELKIKMTKLDGTVMANLVLNAKA